MKTNRGSFKLWLLAILAMLASTSTAQAHFIWVYQADGKIQIVFGEGLEPDQAKFLAGIQSMKAYQVVDGKRQAVQFTQKESIGTGWFEHDCEHVGQTIDVHCRYGVFGRGDSKMLLDYGAKYINLNSGTPAKPGTELRLDLVPTMENGELNIAAFFDGKPVEGVEIEIARTPLQATLTTSSEGTINLACPPRYTVRGKYTVAQAGEVDGKKYDEERYYCTLVIDQGTPPATQSAPQATAETAHDDTQEQAPKLAKVEAKLANFPKGMTSFGADVVDGKIYVIGGKSGRAHAYAKSYQNRAVFCLDTHSEQAEWKTVSENLGLQGLAIVGYQGKVYRIGGLEARNKEGEDHDLLSTAAFKSFDPKTKTWHDLPALPEPRSSHDACVLGDHVYVVGGWAMGDGSPKWATHMLRMDLSKPDSQWEKIEVPFRTRALAVEAVNNQLVVIGGIQESGGTTNDVHIYDIATGRWKDGPEVKTEGGIKSFGCSCVTLQQRLFVSTYDGGIFELSNNGDSWNKVHQLDDGRFFHQMVPVADDRFAIVGGSHMETGSRYEIEVFELK